MKKTYVLLIGALLFLGSVTIYLLQPASVMVGQVQVQLRESRGYVFVANTVGDFLGYGRDNLNGLSFYWTPIASLRYDSRSGVVFTAYSVNALMSMQEQEACKLAQAAFDEAQKRGWQPPHHKLECPLHLL